MDAWLTAFLARSPRPCPACGRPLNMEDGHCLRCKRAVVLGLGSTDFYQLSWGLLVGLLAAIAGIGGFFDVFVLGEGLPPGRPGERAIFLSLIVAGPIGVLALAAALRQRTMFMRLRPSLRWCILLAALLALLGVVVPFGLYRR